MTSRLEQFTGKNHRFPLEFCDRLHFALRACEPNYTGFHWEPEDIKCRRVPAWVAKLSTRKGGDPPYFAIGNTIYYTDGALSGVLTPDTPYRFAGLAHEVYHCWQNERVGFGNMISKYLKALWRVEADGFTKTSPSR
jgi:hypothetical protein